MEENFRVEDVMVQITELKPKEQKTVAAPANDFFNGMQEKEAATTLLKVRKSGTATGIFEWQCSGVEGWDSSTRSNKQPRIRKCGLACS